MEAAAVGVITGVGLPQARCSVGCLLRPTIMEEAPATTTETPATTAVGTMAVVTTPIVITVVVITVVVITVIIITMLIVTTDIIITDNMAQSVVCAAID